MMRELDYLVIAAGIKKQEHRDQYGSNALDPYMYCLQMLVERFCFEIGDIEAAGMIFAEKRRPDLDRQLDLEWKRLKDQRVRATTPSTVDKLIVDLSLKSKELNVAGLQLADLIVSPIGRHLIGKPPREDRTIVESKFRRGWNGCEGYGLIVGPR